MSETEQAQNWIDGRFSSHDGLQLHGRHYESDGDGGRPVLCLPGLTRNARDFHVLATYLSKTAEHRRDVYCLDYRGRGRSDYDADWRNYTPYIELLDTLNFMTIAGLHQAAIVGTSRGGIIAMLMAVMRPTAITACVLNDIGPVIETAGLVRIMGYVGKTPNPASWSQAAEIIRAMNEQHFTELPDSEWDAVARQLFSETNGEIKPDYDAKLANALAEMDLTNKIPDMWPQFGALAPIPTLIVRGENSDLLSEATLEEMTARHPRAATHTVLDQGHAPLLRDRPTMERIAGFLAAND